MPRWVWKKSVLHKKAVRLSNKNRKMLYVFIPKTVLSQVFAIKCVPATVG